MTVKMNNEYKIQILEDAPSMNINPSLNTSKNL